jgi:hypothetical protein
VDLHEATRVLELLEITPALNLDGSVCIVANPDCAGVNASHDLFSDKIPHAIRIAFTEPK